METKNETVDPLKGMDEIIKDKPCILVMTKKDLCDI